MYVLHFVDVLALSCSSLSFLSSFGLFPCDLLIIFSIMFAFLSLLCVCVCIIGFWFVDMFMCVYQIILNCCSLKFKCVLLFPLHSHLFFDIMFYILCVYPLTIYHDIDGFTTFNFPVRFVSG